MAKAIQNVVTTDGVEDEDIIADAAHRVFIFLIVFAKFAAIGEMERWFAEDEECEIARRHAELSSG